MLIAPKTVEDLTDIRERLGSDVLKLTGSGESPSDIIMMEFSKGLFGAKGEFITPGSFTRFKSNGKLSKAKKIEAIPCAEVNDIVSTSASAYSMWKMKTETANYMIRFVHHRSGGFRIEKEYIPMGSAVLWDILSKTLKNSLLSAEGLGDPEYHRDQIEESLVEFKEADVLVYDTIKDVKRPHPYVLWSSIQRAFAFLVAGTAVSQDTKTAEFLEIFNYLNSVWADILERFIQELERQGKGMKNSERSINSTSDMFDRLSAIWYMRTIIMLNFFHKKCPGDKPVTWKASLLTPRAMERAGKRIPELHPMPDLDKMREEVEKHRS